MRIQLSIVFFLLVVSGCGERSTSDGPPVVPDDPIDLVRTEYRTLERAPDETLETMRTNYPSDFDSFHRQWIEKASALPLDGQRAIELLEIACYADVMCHTIEYPLRVATLDYIEANLHTADVLDALKWVSQSYASRLPMDAPNDASGQMHGVLVRSMNIRMNAYAAELLDPKVPSQHRKQRETRVRAE